jgi:UDP-GlcNAc:undecaprenyl-phosphate/decaprenyl-phosphate GlcNAc-1-phosphate transferase
VLEYWHVDVHPYIAALAFGAAAGFAASGLLLLAIRRAPASLPLGDLRGNGLHPPPLGGVAILAAFAVAPFLAAAISDRADFYFSERRLEFLGFLGAASLVFATGLIDDWRAIKPWQKLAGQSIAGLAVFGAGYQLSTIGLPWGGSFEMGILALPATVLWIVFFTNAFNLIDGKDGVATGVAMMAAASLAVIAANTHHPAIALLLVGLTGAALGFLPFNLPSASMILGDAGALLVGFLLASMAIRGTTGVENAVFLSIPVLAMGFAVLDTTLSAIRRLLDRRHPFTGDKDHIHHRLEALGVSPTGILVLVYLLSALFAGAALATHYLHSFILEALIFLAVAATVAFVLIRLGYLVSLWNSKSLLWVRMRFHLAGVEAEQSLKN